MPDIRSFDKGNTSSVVESVFFDILKKINGGFSVKLSWNYDTNENPSVVGFKVYKAKLQQSKISKNYVISQKALEKTSAIKTFSPKNNELYNKSVFSQNSKLKFENSNSNRHDKIEGNISNFSFFQLGIVKSEFYNLDPSKNLKEYSFEDKNVKFGESYFYYISALNEFFAESPPFPILVNIDNLNHPLPPNEFRVEEVDRGLLLIFGNNQDTTVSKFKIYKREDTETDFKLLTSLENNNENLYFLDTQIFPKKTYVYRIFSEDYFGETSLSSVEKIGIFRYIPTLTNNEWAPNIKISSDDRKIKINVENNRPDKILGIKIERRDDWRFEKDFNIKSFNNVYLPALIKFDQNNKIELIDQTTRENLAYSYRITSISKKIQEICFYVSPSLKIGDVVDVKNIQKATIEIPKIQKFELEVVNQYQKTPYVKYTWNITGNWSYIIIKNLTTNTIQRIENFHKLAFLSNVIFGQNLLEVEAYDLENKLCDTYRGIKIKI